MYILTGSQQWAVMKSIRESLTGRAVFLDLEGFSLGELARNVASPSWLERYLDDPVAFTGGQHVRHPLRRTLDELLWRGWLPEMDAAPVTLSGDFFSAYVRTYIERDVRLMLNVDDWQPFGRFVQLAARPSRKDARGILALRQNYPDRTIAPGLVIAPAERFEQLSEHDYVLPWDLA